MEISIRLMTTPYLFIGLWKTLPKCNKEIRKEKLNAKEKLKLGSLFIVFALKQRFMLAQRYNSLPVWEHFQSENYGLNILSRSDSYFFRVPKECEMNKLRFLRGYFVHSFYFKSVIYVDIMNIFKVENMD